METDGAPRNRLAWRFRLWRWLVVWAFSAALAFGDGMVIGYDHHLGRWSLQQERSQLCLINYDNGVERMLVSVALSGLRGTKAAWIVPIPSAPDSASIDIVKGFPALAGTNVLAHAERVLTRQFRRMNLTYFCPALFLCNPDRKMWLRPVAGLDGGDEEVNVHSHKEEMGLTAELVTAQHPGAIFGYLSEKGVELPKETRPVLEQYQADSFSFVVTWLSDSSSFMRESLTNSGRQDLTPAIGISVVFPTRRAYFPLRPTSVYGYARVPIDIYVIGNAFPGHYRRFSQYFGQWVKYVSEADYHVPAALRAFFGGREHIKRLDYTHVTISSQSWALGKDLWFRSTPPSQLVLARLLNYHQLVWVPLVYLLCSGLASIIAGAVVLRRFRLALVRQAGFGLWSSLTLLGFAVATLLTKFRETGSHDVAPQKSHTTRAGIGRKLLFILLFTVVFQALLAAFYLAAKAAVSAD